MNHFHKITSGKVSWYHSDKPLSKEERVSLTKLFGFHPHHLENTRRGKTPRPKISPNKKYVYFVFHIPYLPANSNKIIICDLNCFVTRNTLVTIESVGDIPALNTYFSSTKRTKRVSDRRLRHGAANLFANLMKYILNDLEFLIDEQGEQVDTLNKKIFKLQEASSFIETVSLLRYNQTVAFNALERQSRVVDSFAGEKNPLLPFTKEPNEKWAVVVEAFQTYTYELKVDMGHLEALFKTFETLVTHKTNETIKVLTIFSVVLLPLTLLSSIYGMNFKHLPLSEEPYGFFLALIVMWLIVVIMVSWFKWRKWL